MNHAIVPKYSNALTETVQDEETDSLKRRLDQLLHETWRDVAGGTCSRKTEKRRKTEVGQPDKQEELCKYPSSTIPARNDKFCTTVFRLLSSTAAPRLISLQPKPPPPTQTREPKWEDDANEAEERRRRAELAAVEYDDQWRMWAPTQVKPCTVEKLCVPSGQFPVSPPSVAVIEKSRLSTRLRPRSGHRKAVASDVEASSPHELKTTCVPILPAQTAPLGVTALGRSSRRRRRRRKVAYERPAPAYWKPPDLLLFSEQPVPPTWSNLATFLAPAFFTYYVMAVLVQLPRTKLYRVALLPLVLWLALRAGVSLDFSGKQPEYAYLNKGLAITVFNVAMRATAWTSSNGIADKASSKSSTTSSNNIRSAMLNASDLCNNLRGIGWNWSKGVHIRAPTIRVESRLVFAVLSLGRSLLYMSIGDALDLCVRAFAPQGSGGWSIFDPTLPLIRRYLRSSIITVLVGFGGISVVEMVYSFNAATCVVLFQQHPSQWPPLVDNPWFSPSLAKFWGRDWHQLFRESFVAVGYKPLEGILGQYAVIGAFVVSGILHDVAMRGMGHWGYPAHSGLLCHAGRRGGTGKAMETVDWKTGRWALRLLMGMDLAGLLGEASNRCVGAGGYDCQVRVLPRQARFLGFEFGGSVGKSGKLVMYLS
ncbi:hypothetical protein EDC04DRAFT_2897287 [Pisolithus marmoratus]|nr:hypothetical protein EDC04DRAFT_2897287 [Pisolithus marmoratus]